MLHSLAALSGKISDDMAALLFNSDMTLFVSHASLDLPLLSDGRDPNDALQP